MSDQGASTRRHDVALSVQVKFRCQEGLKQKIDEAAKRNEFSISNEITARLIRSFQEDQQSILENAFMGGNANAAVIRGISALMIVGAHQGDWEVDEAKRLQVRMAIHKLLDELMPFPDTKRWNGVPGAAPSDEDIVGMKALEKVVDMYVAGVRSDKNKF